MPHIPPHEIFQTPPRKTPTTLEVDVAKYQSYLDDINIPEGQKLEVLQALWSIVTNFVDLGFGVHPIQNILSDQHNNKNKIPQTEKEDA